MIKNIHISDSQSEYILTRYLILGRSKHKNDTKMFNIYTPTSIMYYTRSYDGRICAKKWFTRLHISVNKRKSK